MTTQETTYAEIERLVKSFKAMPAACIAIETSEILDKQKDAL